MTNEQICKDMLYHLPVDFYGEVTLSFHRGQIMQSKTITSKKYNPESKSTEALSEKFRK